MDAPPQARHLGQAALHAVPRWAAVRLRAAVVPRGRSPALDRLSLRLWDAYAALKGRANHGSPGEPAEGPVGLDRYWGSRFYTEHIMRDLLPFWKSHAPDRQYGGFITHLDRTGSVYDQAAPKSSAMQGRMVYAFSVGHELDPGGGWLELAREGFRFLTRQLWDHESGGWYHRVSRAGACMEPMKHCFNQAYVLIGLAELYRVSRDTSVLDYIQRTWDLVERHAEYRGSGGFAEACGPDWSVVRPWKVACVHIDLLAAALATHAATGAPRDLERAGRIAQVLCERMVDRRHGCVLEVFHPNWLYHPAVTADTIQFGHNLKAAGLLLQLQRATGEERYFVAARRMLQFCLRFGWDSQWHGFYQVGYRNGRVGSGQKLWWPQCEALPPLAMMFRLSGDPSWRSRFLLQANFCFSHLVDAEHGEWFFACHEDGSVEDATKGGDWKAAYHTVHGCYQASRELDHE